MNAPPKELLVGIDEFTLVLKPAKKVDIMKWDDVVEKILYTFIKLSFLKSLFGSLEPISDKIPAGYTNAISFKNQPFYFAIAWHQDLQNMGICARFSAYAWASYQDTFQKKNQTEMNIIQFLKMVQYEDLYSTRFSRIDLIADYKNYGMDANVNLLYSCIKSGKVIVKNCNGRSTIKRTSAIESDGSVQTFYLGSRKENTKCFLRVYNKKQEQIDTSGIYLKEAQACNDWTRFEVSYRGDYSHQITKDMLSGEIKDNLKLQSYIAQKITEKYRFHEAKSDDILSLTSNLLDVISGNFPCLRYKVPKDNTIEQSINYTLCGSGFLPLLYKIFYIWGEEGVDIFFNFLKEKYKEYRPNRDAINWVNKHAYIIKGQSPDLSKLLAEL